MTLDAEPGYGRTDRWTHVVLIGHAFSKGHVNQTGKKNQQPRPKFQFSASPSATPGTIENGTFAHFMKKSTYLKAKVLIDYKVFYSE